MTGDSKSSICDICRDPGACCRNFPLGLELEVGTTHTEAEQELRERAGSSYAPFIAIAPDKLVEDGKTTWRWACRALGEKGRCTIYEDRPYPCSHYTPQSDNLCSMIGANLTEREIQEMESNERVNDTKEIA